MRPRAIGSPVGTGGRQHRDHPRQTQGHARRIRRTSKLAACLSTPMRLSESAATIADIAVAGTRSSGDGLLSYAVPAHVRDSIEVGQVVWVPLRGKPALGVIVRLHEDAPAFAVKPLLATVDPPTRVSTGPDRNRALVGAAKRQQPLRRSLPLPTAWRLASRAAVSAADRAGLRARASSRRPRDGS